MHFIGYWKKPDTGFDINLEINIQLSSSSYYHIKTNIINDELPILNVVIKN